MATFHFLLKSQLLSCFISNVADESGTQLIEPSPSGRHASLQRACNVMKFLFLFFFTMIITAASASPWAVTYRPAWMLHRGHQQGFQRPPNLHKGQEASVDMTANHVHTLGAVYKCLWGFWERWLAVLKNSSRLRRQDAAGCWFSRLRVTSAESATLQETEGRLLRT